MAKNNTKLKWVIGTIVALGLALATGATVSIKIDEQNYNATIEYSEEQQPASIEDDKGEIITTEEIDGEEIPTVEEVDGGRFEDATTGLSTTEGEYDDLGWAEWYPTNTPEAFKDATLNHCVYANNRFGAQCVSLARVFWWSYANRDVSTCNTGAAKGMMKCAEQNAGDDFDIYWKDSSDKIQSGDWLVFDGGQYGHVGMALGPVVNGYVALLGENQGGGWCEGGGAATNIINISIKNLIGYYRPKAYIKVEPEPEPEPQPEPTPTPVADKCKVRTVKKGDTLGAIMKECKGKVTWGEAMNDYANHWVSTKINPGKTVFYGWTHGSGYGLYYSDVIEYKD